MNGRVVIGHDMRASSPSLAAAFADGVAAQGLDVTRIGLASTDQLYFASGLLDCPGAMFTASHNPAAYNGIKLCRAGAKPVGKDTGLSDISARGHQRRARRTTARPGTIEDRDVLGDYAEFLRSLVDISDIRPLRVAVDAGNGMGGHTTPAVLGAHPVDHPAAVVLRTRRHLPQPRGQSARPRQPRRPSGARGRVPAPTSGWPSTVTPTAVSSSTNSAVPSRRPR